MGKLEKEIESLTGKAETMVDDIVEYAKKHRKLILVVLIFYLTSKYFFGEEEDE